MIASSDLVDFDVNDLEYDETADEELDEDFDNSTAVVYNNNLETGIIIGKYKFQLLSTTECHSNYKNCVYISSMRQDSHAETRFWIYQSNSELGIWRFCARITDTIMFKGYNGKKLINAKSTSYEMAYEMDYIQNTLIHIKLQCYVNMHIHLLTPLVIKTARDYLDNDLEPTPIKCNNIANIHDNRVIHNPNRVVIEHPFYQLQKTFTCGKTDPTELDLHNLHKFSDKLEELYTFSKTTEPPFEFVSEYKFTFINRITITGKIYKIALHRKHKLPKSKTNTIIIYFLAVNLMECGPPSSNPTITRNIGNICKKLIHFMPFCVTVNDNINKFGLFEKYVLTGAYICKLFDYSSAKYMQCLRSELANSQCSSDYSYIGDRYENIFPFKYLNRFFDPFNTSYISVIKKNELVSALIQMKTAEPLKSVESLMATQLVNPSLMVNPSKSVNPFTQTVSKKQSKIKSLPTNLRKTKSLPTNLRKTKSY